jgi:hypothetical protein
MTKYLSGAAAARLLGVNEKTVRSWVRNGKLHARKAAKNRFNILAADVEALQLEREQDEIPDISLLVARIEDVKRKYTDLEQKYIDLEQKYSELTASIAKKVEKWVVSQPAMVTPATQTVVPRKSARGTPVSVPVDMPDGSMLFADFAAKYGVPRATFTHHVKKGIAGDRVETIKRPKPERPEHMEYWLAPDQQVKALAFWERHGVKYRMSDE